MNATLSRRKRGKWLVLIVVIVVVLAIAGFAIYFYEQNTCIGFGCGPISYPVIQSAHAQVNSLGVSNCELTSSVAVCSVYLNGGDSGTVTLNVTNQDQGSGTGGSRAQFMIYSSEVHYINFTSIPTCAYTSAPDSESPSCLISGNSSQTLRLAFAVSQSYGTSSSREPDSITIVIYKTCCWP